MVVFPNAKINIGLQVIRKRKDNFHDLATCFVPVPFCDVLEVIQHSKYAFASSGIAIPGKPEENLCVKAYQLLKRDFGLQEVSIYLHKLIPIGAGLGGGSADAAFMLKSLNVLFELFLADSLLEDYAVQLGSDCAFFIRNKPVMAHGRGNEFEDITLELTGKYLLLIVPPVHVSTADAYAGITPQVPAENLKEVLTQSPISGWKDHVKNDFEKTVFQKYPVLADLKASLYDWGALYASMSGSGSALYGIFEQEPPQYDPGEHHLVRTFRL